MAAPLPKTTRRLVKENPQSSYELKEVPLPALQGDELLVKVGKVALCGTDISLYQWNNGKMVPRRSRGEERAKMGLALFSFA